MTGSDRRVLVIGLGYVGLPLAVRAAETGYRVRGIDAHPDKVRSISMGRSYVEDIDDARLAAVTADGRFRATKPPGPGEDGPAFDIAVIAVPTPLYGDQPDCRYIEQAGRLVGRGLRPGGAVVLESTTYPGTTEGLLAAVIAETSGLQPGTDYDLGFSPERIDPGNRVHTFETTPKIVSGTTEAARLRFAAFYGALVVRTVPMSSPAAAEFTKLFENVFSQVNIALVNELAIVAHDLGLDIWEILDAADTKPHGFLKHRPGPGVGGHCIPVDPGYLAWATRTRLGHGLGLSELAQQINDAMPDYVVRRATELLEHGLSGVRILILGVAYKPGTGDLRMAPAQRIVAQLLAAGAAVTISDPHVEDWTGTPRLRSDRVVSALTAFDLTIVVTDHEEFAWAKIAANAPLVLDCRRRLPPSPTVISL